MEQPSKLQLVDAHCHIDLFKTPVNIAHACRSARIHTIAVTNAPSVFFFTEQLSSDNEYILPAAGLHPELCHSHGQEIDALLDLIGRVKYVGEIGLDYGVRDSDLQERQRIILSRILSKSAEVGGRVLSVHSRRAAADVISMIGSEFPGKVILHWFSGSLREARQGLSCGYYFSVNCAMARSDKGRKLLSELPPDRVITESDAPFLECCSVRETEGYGLHVAAELAQLWKCSTEEVRARIYRNFQKIVSQESGS